MRNVDEITAVIPAAGLSRRLRPLTDLSPKCLLDINGKNLLQRSIDAIIAFGIYKFIIVTGYRKEMIIDFVAKNYAGLDVKFINNPDYENNNNSYSLWLALGFVKKDMLLLDSDILFEKAIIEKLILSNHNNPIAVNFTNQLDDEQVKVELENGVKLKRIGKDVPIPLAAGESIGIALFSSYYLKTLFGILNRKIVTQNIVHEFYELSFQEALESGDERNCIHAIDVSEYKCIEIDTPGDLDTARELAIKYKI
ncbi:MAG: phosphocholine cytidylyltransferase family protein [Ignavibacteriaceae bacterium]|jgi:Predicted sugar nucleotidyltransferases|nr:MAG: phosphocholine cytidylyltransferase family protein [Chlorobiota bacterium]KXK06393.1 MAG: nucleotidyl transferase [Chlorobi bacterium OLB4]MBV6399095.1 Bifunctional IPC transferase and DIPP synthase [Ignavibacteria bacterium]MCC6885313.1 phosphocholine cytidylyltransferase family protein [Ignavibacteriales bacterium]MCE7953284.1 phosphocholine cytidylyltransferase family protein [Chlorobi bacterium CHB7]MDL1887298.1 phosphocholine cytidylyltransferase family protein [Ignavibacteria bac